MTTANQLLNFIHRATSPYHVVEESVRTLKEADFEELDFSAPWHLEKGKCYYTKPYDTSLFAFTLGNDLSDTPCFRIAAAHTDHPGFRIKPHPELTESDYLKINTEAYGGVILNSWLDRPLSIAGKVCLKSDDIFNPTKQLIDMQKPLLTIPNLAIHINKQINKGIELNPQTEMSPLLAMMNDRLQKDQYFLHFLSKELNVDPFEILNFDLYVYNAEKGTLLGMEDDFISAPRLDNLTSVYSLLEGITKAKPTKQEQIHLIALYDNEEIGSRSKQGADSHLTNMILEKIYSSLGKTSIKLYEALMQSFLLSADVSHALHPNYAAKSDPTTKAKLTKGIVLKIDSNQKYAYDVEALSVIEQLCKANDIPVQKFVNRSDATSGSTLGSILSSWLPIRTVDLGVPLLAMHSSRELMGQNDQVSLNRLITAYFEA